VRLDVNENPDSPIELYNLEEDIAEETNIADQYSEIVKEMDQIMGQAHVPSHTFPLFEQNRQE